MTTDLFERYTWKLRNALAEARLNVKTGGVYRDPANPDSCCSTLSYRSVHAVLQFLELGPDDVFVDVGCGKGRVVCCAARRPLRRVVGIENNPEAARAARTNAARLRGRRAPVTILEADARTVDYGEATALYLFNPFGAEVLRAVLARLAASLAAEPRALRIAYSYPRHDQEFAYSGCFTKYAEWPARPDLGVPHPTQFWRHG